MKMNSRSDNGLFLTEIGHEPPFSILNSWHCFSDSWGYDLDKMIVLRVSDNDGVELNGVKLRSTSEVAEALEKILAESSDVTVSVEASDSVYYESIGKAIYGSHRAGFSGERFRILVKGKPWEA